MEKKETNSVAGSVLDTAERPYGGGDELRPEVGAAVQIMAGLHAEARRHMPHVAVLTLLSLFGVLYLLRASRELPSSLLCLTAAVGAIYAIHLCRGIYRRFSLLSHAARGGRYRTPAERAVLSRMLRRQKILMGRLHLQWKVVGLIVAVAGVHRVMTFAGTGDHLRALGLGICLLLLLGWEFRLYRASMGRRWLAYCRRKIAEK